MTIDSQTISSSIEEWRATATEAAQWADRVAELAREMQTNLSAIESAEQLKIAATLALSASQTSRTKARKLKRSAVIAADKAARLAQMVIFDLSETRGDGVRDQILTWSKALSVADRLVALPIETTQSTKKWWKFWKE